MEETPDIAIDIRSEVVKARARSIAEADARGEPRRPLHVLVEQFQEIDLRRLRGDYGGRDE